MFALAMTAALCDAGALCDACKSRRLARAGSGAVVVACCGFVRVCLFNTDNVERIILAIPARVHFERLVYLRGAAQADQAAAPVASFHFLKQEQKSRRVLPYYTCILSPPETSYPVPS